MVTLTLARARNGLHACAGCVCHKLVCIRVCLRSQILDFVDTFAIIMRGKWKQLSFLHVYHHISIFLFYWLNIRVRVRVRGSVSVRVRVRVGVKLQG